VYLLVRYLVIGDTECGWVGPGWQKTTYNGALSGDWDERFRGIEESLRVTEVDDAHCRRSRKPRNSINWYKVECRTVSNCVIPTA
jgi:hypothetical protein